MNTLRLDLLPRLLKYDSWSRTSWPKIVSYLESRAGVKKVGSLFSSPKPLIASGKSYFLLDNSPQVGTRSRTLLDYQQIIAAVCVDSVAEQFVIRKAGEATSFFFEGEKAQDDLLQTSQQKKIALPTESFAYGYVAQIAFKHGVTDNEASMLLQGLADYESYCKSENLAEIAFYKAYSARLVFFEKELISDISQANLLHGSVEEILDEMVVQLFANPLIEDVQMLSVAELQRGAVFSCPSLNSSLTIPKKKILSEEINILNCSLSSLKKLTNEKHLFFSDDELKVIQQYFSLSETKAYREARGLSANPSDVEMEVLAQTWSEHCKHKIFAAEVTYQEDDKPSVVINSLFQETIRSLTSEVSKTRSDLLSVFSDNAGIVRFDEDYAYSCKVETHNAPSMLDPFGGSITGIVGVNRDIIGAGMGFKPIFNLNVLCFANPNYGEVLPPRVFHPSRLLKGVHSGIREGGNQSGIPTIGGAVWFHPSYLARPLVFCGTIGLAPLVVGKTADSEGKAIETKQIENGDYIVMVGGLVGRDGIHGATSSSQAMSEIIPSSMVQIADPITQKKSLDFILAARDKNLFSAITDNGAGGLSSSVGEMATLCGGAEVDVACVPLKELGLMPWEIFVSESQERMTLAVNPNKLNQLKKLAKKFDCTVAHIGVFNDSGDLVVKHESETVASLPLSFLHDGLPQLKLNAQWIHPLKRFDEWKKDQNLFEVETSFKTDVKPKSKEIRNNLQPWRLKTQNYNITGAEMLHRLLRRPNIASKETLVRQYDHEVQGRTVLKPFDGVKGDAPMDAGIVRPLFDSKMGIVAASGGAPRFASIDAGAMAAAAVDEAVRNLLCVGGNISRAVGLDNFCWPDPLPAADGSNPRYKHNMGQLVRACFALKRVCGTYGIPLVSGKDSMKNDYRHKELHLSIVPTMLFTAVAPVENCNSIVTSVVKEPGANMYLLGDTYAEMGESEHHYALFGEHNFTLSERTKENELYQHTLVERGGVSYRLPESWPHPDFTVPLVRDSVNIKNYAALKKCIQLGLVSAAHDLSEGGLAIAAAEMCFGNGLGLELNILDLPLAKAEDDFFERGFEKETIKVFSESNGRILLEISKSKEADFLKNMQHAQIYKLGKVTKSGRLVINSGSGNFLNEQVEELLKSFKKTFAEF